MDILETIREHAAKTPDAPAFVMPAGSITYEDLWTYSGRVAGWLAGLLLKEGQPIPVYGHKNIWQPVCFLACVRSGKPYVPLDTNMPAGRISDILEAVNSPVVFATEPLPDGIEIPEAAKVFETAGIPESAKKDGETAANTAPEIPGSSKAVAKAAGVISAEEVAAIAENADIPAVSADCANAKTSVHYIIFTSGSTGKPKGVEVTTGNLEAYLAWSVGLVDEKAGVFLNQAPFSFDLSVMDTWTGLATGSAVVCLSHDMVDDPAKRDTFLKDKGITYWVSTPSFADLCLGDPAFGPGLLPDLKKFLFCGEPLKKATVERLMERFPAAGIVNTYGPTETTVCVTAVPMARAMLAAEGPLPVGYVKPGTEMYTMSEDGKRLPAGEKGELIITGDTVAKGYYHNPEKTAAAFFTDDKGNRAYHTGDLGYVTSDGMVYCAGRADSQIKLHGYRIELGDIEKNLMQIPGVKSAAAIPEKKDGEIYGIAACILQEPGEDTSYARRKAIRNALAERVPAYMVPKRVAFFESFPMTNNGKLDRKALEESF